MYNIINIINDINNVYLIPQYQHRGGEYQRLPRRHQPVSVQYYFLVFMKFREENNKENSEKYFLYYSLRGIS